MLYNSEWCQAAYVNTDMHTYYTTHGCFLLRASVTLFVRGGACACRALLTLFGAHGHIQRLRKSNTGTGETAYMYMYECSCPLLFFQCALYNE
jgi:hypothetical protein